MQKNRIPSPGNVRMVLTAVEKAFPNFATDAEMRQMALIGMAQCVGMVAGWTYHQNGAETCQKGLQMVYAMAFATAEKADALLREKDREKGKLDDLLSKGSTPQ